MPGVDMSSEEIRLAKTWFNDDEEAPSAIAKRLKRNKSTITRLFAIGKTGRRRKVFQKRGRGRAPMLTHAKIEALKVKLDEMIVKAKGRWEVTLDMLKISSRTKASTTTMRRELKKKGVKFYKNAQQTVAHRPRHH